MSAPAVPSSSPRRPRWLLGVRARMLVVAAAIVAVFVAYVAYGAARQSERDLEQVRSQMLLTAELAGSRLDDHLGNLEQLLKTLGATLAVDPRDVAANDERLRRLSPQLPANVYGVSLWAPDGANLGSSELVGGQARPSAADRRFFAAALRQPGVVAEAPVRLRTDGEWTAVMALAIVRDERTVAVLSVSTRLATVTDLLDPQASLPAGAVVSIANGDGTIVARSRDGAAYIGKPAPIDRTAIARRLAEGAGTTRTSGLDGVPRIFGFRRASSVPWLVFVGIPVDVALAAARAHTRDSLALGLAMLLAGLGVAAWAAGRMTRVLRRSEERLTLALEGSEQALFDWDLANDVVYYSARASTLRGGPDRSTEVTPEAMRAYVHPDDLPGVLGALERALAGKTPTYEAEFRIRRDDGAWLWIRSRGRVVERDANGRALRLVGTDADISRRKANEESMRQRAELDALTGLPNRAAFTERLAAAIERAGAGRAIALLFLDIDHFKAINDTHGHGAGDTLLQVVAERLVGAVRGGDTVARLAGDEFTVLLESLGRPQDAELVAAKVVEALRPPVRLGDAIVRVSASVGVAVLGDGQDAAELLRRADAALYAAKRAGRDRYATSEAIAA